MSIVRRMRTILRSRFHNPDADTALEEVAVRAEGYLAEARGQLAHCAEQEHHLRTLLGDEQEQARRMLSRARQALQRNQSLLAREAVRRYLLACRQAQRYQALLDKHQTDMLRVNELLDQLEERRFELAHQRDQLQLRQQISRAKRTLAEGLYGERGRFQLDHAEEAVAVDEYLAEAYQELAEGRLLTGERGGETVISPASIEATLAALRGELGLPSPDDTRTK